MRKVSSKLEDWLENFNNTVAQLVEDSFKPTATNAREGLANLTKGLVTDLPKDRKRYSAYCRFR